jgi:hypothetical protein
LVEEGRKREEGGRRGGEFIGEEEGKELQISPAQQNRDLFSVGFRDRE